MKEPRREIEIQPGMGDPICKTDAALRLLAPLVEKLRRHPKRHLIREVFVSQEMYDALERILGVTGNVLNIQMCRLTVHFEVAGFDFRFSGSLRL